MTALNIHTLLSNRRSERNFSIKIKRNRDTQRLFLDTKRSVRNIRVFCSYEFVRVRCHTKNASLIYLPGDHDEPVLFNQIQKRILSLRNVMKSKSTVWLAVMRRFYHEKQNYDVGDIIKIQKAWLGRRFLNWMRTLSTPEEDTGTRLDTYIYPRKKCSRTPVIDLQRNCKQCDPPTRRSYMSLAETVSSIDPPFIMTIPFDPFTRSVKRHAASREDGGNNIHQNNNTTTSYFEQVIIDGFERFSIFLTSFGEDDDEITAIAIPEHLQFNAEYTDDNHRIDVLHDGAEVNLTDTDVQQVKQRLEPILLRIDNTDELTQINLKPTTDSMNPTDSENCSFSQEFEMQCFLRYKAHVMRSDIPATPPCREKQALTGNHPYYNIVLNQTDDAKIIPSMGMTSFSSEEPGDEDEIDMVSFDENGGFLMAGARKKANRKGDYLSPLNGFTKGYSHFKQTASQFNNESGELPDTMVIGVEGYVQVKGSTASDTKINNDDEENVGDDRRKQQKKHFWKQFSKQKRKHGFEKNDSTSKPSTITTPATTTRDNQTVQVNYYQPMFNIFQEKPPVPPKPLLSSLSPRSGAKGSSSPSSLIKNKKPEVNEKRKYLPESRARLSLKPLLQSFDYEDSSNCLDDAVTRFEEISPSAASTKIQGKDQEPKVSITNQLNNPSDNSTVIYLDGQPLHNANPQTTSFNEKLPKVPAKRNRYSSSSLKPLLESFDIDECHENKPNLSSKKDGTEQNQNKRNSMKPLLSSFDDSEEYYDEDLNTETFTCRTKRIGVNNAPRYSAALDSRINYFESKPLINSP